GYKGAIITPHYDPGRYEVSSDKIYPKIEELKSMIKEEGLNFEIFPGNEIQIDENTIKLLKEGKILRLNDSRYILCELPFFTKPIYAREIFYQIQLEGWTPIMAHPERYSYTENNIDWLKDFIKSGVLLQLN